MARTQLINITNFIGFQLIWFLLIIGAGKDNLGLLYSGYALYFIFMVVQYFVVNNKKLYIQVFFITLLVGIIFDTLLQYFSLVDYKYGWNLPCLSPLWILCLWTGFGVTLLLSLSWILPKKALGFLLGAIGGGLSYLAAERLSAIVINNKPLSIIVIAVSWGLVMVTLSSITFPRMRKIPNDSRDSHDSM